MADITAKKTWFTRSVEGTDRKGEGACVIRAKTKVFSGFWEYKVMLDTPGETFRSSGHFLQVLHAMKNNPVASRWLGLLKDVSGTICDQFGSATHFFSKEQMLCIAALKNEAMSIEQLAGLLSLDRSVVHQSLTRLQSLDLVSRDDFSDPEVAKKKYKLVGVGHLIHGLLIEDRKFCAMQAMVDRKMA